MDAQEIRRKTIAEHKNVDDYLRVPGLVDQVITGTTRRPRDLVFLALLADIVRQFFPDGFVFMETGAGVGDTICALGYHMHEARAEHYLGVDTFDEDELAAAVANVRDFGPRQPFQTHAMIDGHYKSAATVSRVRATVDGVVHMLFINAAESADRVAGEFERYADMVPPGGVVVFSGYRDNETPDVTPAVDALDKTGWNVVGPLTVGTTPALYVMQREV